MAETKRKPGNPNWKKGGPSPNPKGRGIAREVLNKDIVDALHNALHTAHPDGADGYMLDIAQNKPALFVGMLQKAMPNETAVNMTVSLGDAMAEAQARLAEYEAKMIDITPAADSNAPAAVDITPTADSEKRSAAGRRRSAVDLSQKLKENS